MKALIYGLILVLFTSQSFQASLRPDPDKPINVSFAEGRLNVRFPDSNNTLKICFAPCGVNQIFAMERFEYYASSSDQPKNVFNSGTDWIGPYFVRQKASKSENINQQFTGGWHGSNGDGTGKPTAFTKNTVITADGKQVSEKFSGVCDSLKILVVNHVQGYDNKNTSILQETVTYQINPKKQIQVQVKITALENITIERYYGMQSVNFALFDSVTYATPCSQINAATVKANSRCSSNTNLNSIKLTGNTSKHFTKLTIDTSVGLGSFEHLGENLPKAFSASYGKSYFNLVNGKDLLLNKGDSVCWQGTYEFQ